MNSVGDRLKRLNNPALTPDERALLRCRVAADFIHAGRHEEAKDALGNLWHGIGDRPELKGLSILTTAEVLLQCGVLSGWLGSVRNVSGAQEKAKDLLSEALRLYESQGQRSKVSEVQYEFGLCYKRAGAYDEARIVLAEALKGLGEQDTELKAKILIRRSSIENCAGRYHDSWDILEEAKAFFEGCGDALKGRWHGQRALVLRRLATSERRSDYADRAIIEFTAAIYHYEQAKHERYSGNNLNNLAMLLHKVGRHEEAHKHLNRAHRIFARLKDPGNLAQVNETRARVLVAEERYEEAARVIAGAVQTLEKGGENGLLADALTVQGIALARLGDMASSLRVLRRAMNVATDAGATSNAGQAALTLIEEHAERLSDAELYGAYLRADRMLKDTQDAEDIARLRACANIVVKRLRGPKLSDKDFSLPRVVRMYEARFVEQALELEAGSVTRAAKRLGIKHQTMTHLLKTRHRQLLRKRTPAISRKRNPHASDQPRGTESYESDEDALPVSILFVEDNRVVAEAVRETLELEGWSVESCSDGSTALRRIKGREHFDLFLFDNDLPGVHGIELIRRARQLPHRMHTPIIMFSASDLAREAHGAGADVFLKKPNDVKALVGTINRLLLDQLTMQE
ncbi:MAG TPA: response regulator [Pyrinomonadaceae bacterium]|nr:response regulator [Pyrinomonadaceae bacterium]